MDSLTPPMKVEDNLEPEKFITNELHDRYLFGIQKDDGMRKELFPDPL